MNDLETLMEARETWKHYAATMHRLIGITVACWLASVPITLYVPILLIISMPAAAVAGVSAWWTYYDAHHGTEVGMYRPRASGPRERLAAAEAAYRRTIE